VVVVSTPAVALADAKKGVSMFLSEAINVPVLGIMKTWLILRQKSYLINKYYLFGKKGKKAEDLGPILRRNTYCTIHTRSRRLRSSCSDANSSGEHFDEVTRNVVQETVNRNENLPASEAVKITTMAGCSALKKIEK
jgi:ATP-binding protein involved in chromosome partitioning